MSEPIADTEARLATVLELHEIVGALRALAATRTQQAQKVLAATRAYGGIVANALGRAAALLPAEPRPSAERAGGRGVVVFCAEHGFAGAFNRRLLEGVGQLKGAALFVAGTRGTLLCRELGLEPAWSVAMATQVGALGATARRVSEELFGRFAAGALTGVDIVYAKHLGGERFEVTRESLLPVEPVRRAPPSRSPPLTNVQPEALFRRLIEAYLFAELVLAAAESFASENAARLAAMAAARRNIDDKLDELRAACRRLRQEQITSELLDVVVGAAAQETRD
jgi:F-type H+-transporting ATPase subunit gamma